VGELHRESSQLRKAPCHRSVIAGIALLTFLFSANGLLFGEHAAEEMLSEATRMGGDSHDSAALCELHSASHPHDHSQHAHSGSECCGVHGHSHDFRSAQPPSVSPSFSSSPRRFFDNDAYIPEVCLERFIPPQNRA
jgi:hypothetical protein